MPNSLPYAVFHFKKFVANLIHSSFGAPKSGEKNKFQIILKRFSLGEKGNWGLQNGHFGKQDKNNRQ